MQELVGALETDTIVIGMLVLVLLVLMTFRAGQRHGYRWVDIERHGH